MNDAVPFTIVVPTIYGPMLVNRYDINQTNALFKTGAAVDHDKIVILQQVARVLGDGLTFVDIGANMGTYTIGMARSVETVHSFEPQRLIYNLLVGSVALNGFSNVWCHNVALGNHEAAVEIPQFDYNREMNFGSVEFGEKQHEKLEQDRQFDPTKRETVPLRTLDSFNLARAAIIKLDAEGMEHQVLDGAKQTLDRCRPVMLIEYLKNPPEILKQRVQAMGYAVYLHTIDFLCIPNELTAKFDIGTGP